MKVKEILEKTVNNWPAKIISLVAAILLFLFFQFNSVEERFFTLSLDIRQNEGFILSGSYPSTVRVRVKGEEEELFRIKDGDLIPYIDLTSVEEGGSFSVPILIEKSGDALYADPLEISVTPMEVEISLEKKLFKSVEVVPNIEGYPAHGYELAGHTIIPEEIKVSGPKSVIQELTYIPTRSIDVSGKKESFTMRISLEKGNKNISFPETDTVEFRGVLQESIRIDEFSNVDIIAMDLDVGLGYSADVNSGEVRIQGTQLQLESVRPEQINLLVDCSSVDNPGKYLLPAIPDVPLGLLVLDYEPDEVELRVWRMEEEEEGGL